MIGQCIIGKVRFYLKTSFKRLLFLLSPHIRACACPITRFFNICIEINDYVNAITKLYCCMKKKNCTRMIELELKKWKLT